MNLSAVTLFNWNGKSFIKIITDKRLLRLCVDEVQNTIMRLLSMKKMGMNSISVPEID